MTDFKKAVGIYIGRELSGSGKTKEGKPWKKYRLKFKPYEQSEKSFGFGFFQKCEVSTENNEVKWLPLPEMVEEEWYTITYAEKAGTWQGKPITYKTMIELEKGKQELTDTEKYQSTPVTLTLAKREVLDWDTFAASYNAAMTDDPKKHPMHMLGAYIANRHTDEFMELIKFCKKNFEENS